MSMKEIIITIDESGKMKTTCKNLSQLEIIGIAETLRVTAIMQLTSKENLKTEADICNTGLMGASPK